MKTGRAAHYDDHSPLRVLSNKREHDYSDGEQEKSDPALVASGCALRAAAGWQFSKNAENTRDQEYKSNKHAHTDADMRRKGPATSRRDVSPPAISTTLPDSLNTGVGIQRQAQRSLAATHISAVLEGQSAAVCFGDLAAEHQANAAAA